MVFAGIVAGGTGSRMGADIPKQFLKLKGEEIILRCVRKFLDVSEIDRVYIAVHPDWKDFTKELLGTMLTSSELDRVVILEGGSDRNSSVFKIISSIEAEYQVSDNDILLTHDAVRPFVSTDIIRENISCAQKYTVCTTAVPATDTIICSNDSKVISSTLDRSVLWHAQTPQSFLLKAVRAAYDKLNDDQRSKLTDICGIFTAAGEKIHIVEGDPSNIKLTTPFDLKIAEAVLD